MYNLAPSLNLNLNLNLTDEIKQSNSNQIAQTISRTMVGNTFHHHFHILYDIRTLMGPSKKIYTEIGTFHGGSVCTMLQHPFETEFNCIDPMVVGSNQFDLLGQNLIRFNKYDRAIKVHKAYSTNLTFLSELKSKNFRTDILFIDGDHVFDAVVSDFISYEKFVNPGGYIIFDDYLDYRSSPQVRPAVDHIVQNLCANSYEIIGTMPNYQNAYCSYELAGLNEFIIKKIV